MKFIKYLLAHRSLVLGIRSSLFPCTSVQSSCTSWGTRGDTSGWVLEQNNGLCTYIVLFVKFVQLLQKTHYDPSDSVRDELKDDDHKTVVGQFKDEANSFTKHRICGIEPNMILFQMSGKKYAVIQNTKKSKRGLNICSKT